MGNISSFVISIFDVKEIVLVVHLDCIAYWALCDILGVNGVILGSLRGSLVGVMAYSRVQKST